ncbi:Hypothetical protein D9617_25g062090 [Elsinoe fawcettii]|nr:Hypothetical protein D9617_25g062090 [Elsinoe fawcettii]
MASFTSALHPSSPVFVTFEGKIPSAQSPLATQFYTTLSALVEKYPGFISQTPFQSIDQQGGQVLYVRFESEETLHAWKNDATHLRIQAKGKADIFADYRLRIGNEVTERDDGSMANLTVSAGKYLLLWQYPISGVDQANVSPCSPSNKDKLDPELWQELVDAATYVNDASALKISSWPDLDTAKEVRDIIPRLPGDDLRLIYVERDYGKFQRGEAPSDADRCQAAAASNNTAGLKDCQ